MSKKKYKAPLWVDEILSMANPDALVLEPREHYDAALIGVDTHGRLVYSRDKVIKSMVKIDGMDQDDAEEFYEYNMVRSLDYVPQETRPIIVSFGRTA